MAIKKLQNDFTTPEQSQRLSKLGVPTDSANGILLHYAWAEENLDEENWEAPRYIENDLPASQALDMYLTDQDEYDIAIPCWSVGRLEEIYVIARGIDTSFLLIERGEDMVQYLIRLYEDKVKDLDFSKLED